MFKRKIFLALVLAFVCALVTGAVLAATLTPDNLTPTAPEPGWSGTQWLLSSSSDTAFGEAVCAEFAISSDGSCDSATLSDYTRFEGSYVSSGGQGSLWAFAITPPTVFKNVAAPQAVCYQFYVDQDSDNCEPGGGGSLYSGFNWDFNTGPNAVTLRTLNANSARLPLAAAVVALGGVAAGWLVWRRRK